MNVKVLAIVLLVSIFVLGCTQSGTNGYASYNQQPQGQQGQYVGGGCGVAPQTDYESTPVNDFSSVDSL